MVEGNRGNPPKWVPKFGTYDILKYIENGGKPSDLWTKGRASKRTILRRLNELQGAGKIQKWGKGTWVITDKIYPSQKTDKIGANPTHVTPPPTPNFGTHPDIDRFHGIRVSVPTHELPREDRARRLIQAGIEHSYIPQGWSFIFNGWRVWWCKASFMLQSPPGWHIFGDTSAEAVRGATEAIYRVVMALEKRTGYVTRKQGYGYPLKWSRGHHALVKNAFALDRYDKGERLFQIRDVNGVLWGQFDCSEGPELDILGPNQWQNASDHKTFQNHFNYIRGNPGALERAAEAVPRVNEAIATFSDELKGYVAQNVAVSNAVMAIGAALKTQSEIMAKMSEKSIDIKGGGPDNISMERVTEVEFKEDMAQFVEPYRGTYRNVGPFRKGAKVFLSAPLADILIKTGRVKLAINDKPTPDKAGSGLNRFVRTNGDPA